MRVKNAVATMNGAVTASGEATALHILARFVAAILFRQLQVMDARGGGAKLLFRCARNVKCEKVLLHRRRWKDRGACARPTASVGPRTRGPGERVTGSFRRDH